MYNNGKLLVKFVTTILLSTSLLIISGCAPKRIPITLDQMAFTKTIDPITIMPILDARTNKTVPYDKKDSQKFLDIISDRLEILGYTVQFASWKAVSSDLDTQDLLDMNIDELCNYIPSDNPTALIFTLEEMRDDALIGIAFNMGGTATLISIKEKKEIWKDTAVKRLELGPLAQLFINEKKGAFSDLTLDLFLSLPKKNKIKI